MQICFFLPLFLIIDLALRILLPTLDENIIYNLLVNFFRHFADL
jgi:hypothetical protein